MTYTLNWFVPDRILYVTILKDTPIRTWGNIQADVLAVAEQCANPIHLIIDAEANLEISNINDFKALSGLKQNNSTKVGRVAIIQNSIVTRFFATLAIQIFTPLTPYDLVGTLDQAVAVLKSYDEKLQLAAFPDGKPSYAIQR